MRIGYDASVVFSSAGGTRTYAVQLLTEVIRRQPDWTYFLYTRRAGEAAELRQRWKDANVTATVVPGALNAVRMQARMPAQLRKDSVDLFHSLGYFLPLRWSGAKVVTIHDLNVYLNWRSWMRPNSIHRWIDLAAQTPLAARAADRILTDSQFSKDSICRLLRVPPERVNVTYLAPDEFFDAAPEPQDIEEVEKLTGREPFVLYVGVLAPQKNLTMLIRAFAASSLPRAGVRLVLAGTDRGAHSNTLKATAQAGGVGERLQLTGFVSRSVLRALYHQALAVVLPSHGEGFGLPLVEAMAAGAPVLAANRQSLPEVVGEAGRLFEPDDVAGLAALLTRLKDDSSFRSELRTRGHEQRQRFSWRSAAGQTIAVYDEVLAARRRS